MILCQEHWDAFMVKLNEPPQVNERLAAAFRRHRAFVVIPDEDDA